MTCLTISVGGPAQAPATPTSSCKVNPKITLLISKALMTITPLPSGRQAFSRDPVIAGATAPASPSRSQARWPRSAAPEDSFTHNQNKIKNRQVKGRQPPGTHRGSFPSPGDSPPARASDLAVNVAAEQFFQVDAGFGVDDGSTRRDEFFRISRGQLDKFIPDDPLGADGGDGIVVNLESWFASLC